MKNHPHIWPIARTLRGSAAALRRQHGAFLITFALFMLFLLGFMGIALDFGRLFVVKTELQTAMDSCALAAARELNGQGDSITRARSAGMAAGNSNNVNLQSSNWNGAGKIATGNISFFDGSYAGPIEDDKAARYAECKYTMSSIKLWLLQAMGAFTGDSATWSNNGAVGARAVATRAPSQTACIIPVALRWDTGLPTVGQWIPFVPGKSTNKNMTWGNLDRSESADTTATQLRDGYCVSPKPGKVYTHGKEGNKVVEPWNFRFGIYKSNPKGPTGAPDYSSYRYYNNSPSDKNWTGLDANGSIGNAYQDFLAKRSTFTPCGASPSACGLGSGGYQTVAQTATLRTDGADRRIVTVPITTGNNDDFNNKFACMLILQPMEPTGETSMLEYLGLATDPASPCKGSGIAGGTTGPVVPTLVR